jgi:hypothetical protein
MLKIKNYLFSLITFALIIFMSRPAFARSISLKDAGVALWIFIIIGAIIILLQLIPAIILFFTFVGTTTGIISKRKRVTEKLPAEEKEKVEIPGYEPAPVKR